MQGSTLNLSFPLDFLHARASLPLPEIARVEGVAVPEPYRHLLVHAHDMTPTLSAFHAGPIALRVLGRLHDGDTLFREVVLLQEKTGAAVEFGAICIHLNCFDAPARAAVLAGHLPLGTILADYGVAHVSCPQAFLKVVSSPQVEAALELAPGPWTLYGRRNILAAPDGRVIADILEILPPHPRG